MRIERVVLYAALITMTLAGLLAMGAVSGTLVKFDSRTLAPSKLYVYGSSQPTEATVTAATASTVLASTAAFGPSEIACTDTGNPDAAVYSITTPTKSQYQVTATDSDGCRIQLGETSIEDGQIIEVINVGSANVTMSDESGVAETGGTITLGQYDTLALRYIGDRWVEVSTTNN